jgi:uncharacterized membrane protein YgaE (UPF0421/DUF939 family)
MSNNAVRAEYQYWMLRFLDTVRTRLRGRMLPIMQNATAAVGAWLLATAILPDPRPAFAAIAAVIAIGVTHGERAGRALQLVGGVVLGITIATLLISIIGTGPWQIGVLIILAMTAATAVGAGEVLVVESAVSAILLVALDPGAAEGFSATRIAEGAIGGAVALAVSSFLFPPDPALAPGRVAQAMFVELGRALERIATALDARDPGAAERALIDARQIDEMIREVEEEVSTGQETAKYTPPRRSSRVLLDRYARSIPQVDYAVRNTRVLARHVVSLVREGEQVPDGLSSAVRDLSNSVWELAASYDAPQHAEPARRLAVQAAAGAAAIPEASTDLVLVRGQLRSAAADLVRAAELVTGDEDALEDRPTEELLVVAPA